MKIRKAVIPVAGWGTRFLPATKSVAKEMLPIVDMPTIHYIVQEICDANITQVIFVNAAGKSSIEDYFDRSYGLEKWLEERGKTEQVEKVRKVSEMIEVCTVRQKDPLGLANAVSCVRDMVGDEPFAVLVGDDIFVSEKPAMLQMIEAYQRCQKSIVGVKEVPDDKTHLYGIIDPEATEMEHLFKLKSIVEKPTENPPSNYAAVGRYVLTPDIFDCIDQTPKGNGGEIQITDALDILNRREGGGVYALDLQGVRHDAGDVCGWVKANIAFAMERPEFADELRELFRTYLPE
jgi:UTP--glucose-1-phosphate uridylyltransferase